MGRTPCCSKMGLNRGPWTTEEDNLLSDYIKNHGEGGWRTLPKKAGLLRCGKSCRLRWMNYLRPDVKRGQILPDEEDLILRLHRLLGNRWSLIAGRIPGRTDNEIKNYWNTHLSRKLISQGIDPRTHKPLAESELGAQAPLDGNSNKVDSENSLTSVSDSGHKHPEAGIVHGNIEALQDNVENHHSPELEHPETSVTGSLHSLNDTNISNIIPPLVFQETSRQQYSSNAVNINRSLIPHRNDASESGLQGIDASLFLRRNSITNTYFMAPPVADAGLQSIPSFTGSIFENAPYEGSSIIFEQYEMPQRQARENPPRMDVHNMTQFATTEDCNPDIFSYFMESLMGEDQLHEETNKNGASSVSGNRQQFSHDETTNQLGYDAWSTMPPPSEFPLNSPEKL